jgi:hypothetical protein
MLQPQTACCAVNYARVVNQNIKGLRGMQVTVPHPHFLPSRHLALCRDVDDDDNYENKPVWTTWVVGVLSGVRDVETYIIYTGCLLVDSLVLA